MENTYKPNDYFAARFLNEDKSVDALLANGIDPQTSVLQTPDFYKNKKKVQEKFVKEDGTFDDKSFNEFYNQIHDEYLALSSIDTMNYIMEQYNTNPDVFSVSGKKTPKKAIYSFAENPMHLNEGMSGFNE